MDHYAEAIRRLQALCRRAQRTALREPTAAALATTDGRGHPAVRTVLIKAVDQRGLVFYTNLRSRKGRELADNPRAALCLFWDPLRVQVLVEGRVIPVSHEEADAYWAARPRTSQLGAWASEQSAPLPTRVVLLARFARVTAQFAGRAVPRPPQWSGFRVVPDRIEFWSSRPDRLHERMLYRRRGRQWTRSLLYP